MDIQLSKKHLLKNIPFPLNSLGTFVKNKCFSKSGLMYKEKNTYLYTHMHTYITKNISNHAIDYFSLKYV
jgi:hypothetical protein